jgi:glyoxylase-like metal-dependent hydrolase (beta-lactamase superfamily II)
MGGHALPVQAFLITHPEGVLLFDTGLGGEYPAFDQLLTPVRRSVEDALVASNVRLADVRAVINYHLHYTLGGES